ncbi:hypothetical protein [Asanoa siamensis]|uniref:hypothetical protein n=1 Tax=Asanoa siamensis TaxID=926357 RepID=UPI001941AE1B|nr:hypothetical protein [Asanoa siamensis]
MVVLVGHVTTVTKANERDTSGDKADTDEQNDSDGHAGGLRPGTAVAATGAGDGRRALDVAVVAISDGLTEDPGDGPVGGDPNDRVSRTTGDPRRGDRTLTSRRRPYG